MKAEQVSGSLRSDRYPSRVNGVPEITKRLDPVLYSTWTPDSPITQAQSDDYEQYGYLFLDRFFDSDEVAVWKEEIVRLQRFYREREADYVIREPGSDEVRSVFAVHENNAVFRELAEHKRLTDIAQYLLRSNTYIHQSRINFKPGFSGKEFYWHSDFETWHIEDGMPGMRALSISIALEDNNPYNGPLMVMPGSHKKFISCVGRTPENHFKQSLRKQEYGVPDKDSLKQLVQEGGIDMPVGNAGSVLLFDCNLMHGSNSNISPYPRSNVFIVYNSVENRLLKPYSGQLPRPSYIAAREIP